MRSINWDRPSNNWGLSSLALAIIVISSIYFGIETPPQNPSPLDDGVAAYFEQNDKKVELDNVTPPPVGSVVSVSVSSLNDIHSFFGFIAKDGTLLTSLDQFLSSQFPISKGQKIQLPIQVEIATEDKFDSLAVINCDQTIFTDSPNFSKNLETLAQGGPAVTGCKRHSFKLH